MTRIRKCTGRFVETPVDGELVVMNVDSGEFFTLRDTALAIWNGLDRATTTDNLVAALARDYAADSRTLADDVGAFVTQLVDAGLAERA